MPPSGSGAGTAKAPPRDRPRGARQAERRARVRLVAAAWEAAEAQSLDSRALRCERTLSRRHIGDHDSSASICPARRTRARAEFSKARRAAVEAGTGRATSEKKTRTNRTSCAGVLEKAPCFHGESG